MKPEPTRANASTTFPLNTAHNWQNQVRGARRKRHYEENQQQSSKIPATLLENLEKKLISVDQLLNSFADSYLNISITQRQNIKVIDVLNKLAVTRESIEAILAINNNELSQITAKAGSTKKTLFKSSCDNVLSGTGLVSTGDIEKNQEIGNYSGPLVYRKKSANYHSARKFYVFSVIEKDGQIKTEFHKEDTYAAWTGCYLKQSGKNNKIEIGRIANNDTKYLNHSKQPNVFIEQSIDAGAVIDINDCESLTLKVIALKHIKPQTELTFDYDPDVDEKNIDFTINMVEIPDQNEAIKINKRVIELFEESKNSQSEPQNKHQNKDDFFNSRLYEEISNLMKTSDKKKTSLGRELNFKEFKDSLSEQQKKLLRSIFSPTPDLPATKQSLTNLYKSPGSCHAMTTADVTKEHMQKARELLARTFFNKRQTNITVDEVSAFSQEPPNKAAKKQNCQRPCTRSVRRR